MVQATSEEHIYQTSRRYVSDDSSLNFRVSLARQFRKGRNSLFGALAKLRKATATISSCLPACNNFAPAGRIFGEILFDNFSKICRENYSSSIKI